MTAMTDKQKEFCKSQLANFLKNDLKIDITKPFLCLNPEHPDHSPSMSFNKKNNTVHCFSCGVTYDIFDLIGVLYKIEDTAEKFKKVDEIIKGTPEGYKGIEDIRQNIQSKTSQPKPQPEKELPILMEYYKQCRDRLPECDYLRNRGISDETAKKFLIGYDFKFYGIGGKPWKALIIPTDGVSYAARNTDTAEKKERSKKHGTELLFNYATIKTTPDKPIFIVEGEIDALSYAEIGENAISLGGVANFRKIADKVKFYKENYGTDFKSYFLIALDNDDAGRQAAEKLKKDLEKHNLKGYILNEIYGKYKDANEFLQANKEEFIKAVKGAKEMTESTIRENSEQIKNEYIENSNKNYLQHFINGIGQAANTEYTETGFKKLDEILDGGLYEGLYFVGAVSSLGKTTLIIQMADQIAKAGTDVLIFSLEMSRNEIIAKSISRETMLYCLDSGDPINYAKTTRGITTARRWKNYCEEEKKVIFESMENYGKYAENIYIFEGVGDIGVKEIKETIEKHIEITGKRPIVIIDYIQILAPIDIRATDKQNVDKIVLELKRISRDLKLTVLGISSVNRSKYNEKISMEAFKESGSIEYGSDVLIGLQFKGAGESNFDTMAAKRKDPREIELVILKSRNGATGNKINMEFYPLFNYFKEI